MRTVAVLVAFVLLGGEALRAQDLEASRERLRAMVREQLGGPTQLPSMVVAVVHHDAIVWEEGFGWADQQRRIAATPATPYYLASVTKAFTAMALARLADDGKLDMNRSVNAYLGSHKIRPAIWDERAITVQSMADQVSGLSTFNLGCAAAASCRLETIIDRFGVIVGPPGQNFNYSNLGYAVLGEVVAHASKQRYGEFLRRAIFQPLGMQDCEVAAGDPPRRAAVRYITGTSRTNAAAYASTPGASSAFCSAHSLALFARALLGAKGPALLPTGGVPATQTGTPVGTLYSRGWWIQPDYVGRQLIEAQGGTNDATTLVRLIPAEQLAVIVLANMGADVRHVADAVVDEFVPAIRERRKTWTPPAPFARQRRPMSPELVGTWVGAIDTYRGKRPLTMSIDAAGAVTVKGALAENGAEADIVVLRPGASGDRVFGLLPEVNLGIEEATPGSYDLQLGLGLYGTRLAGSATTQAREGKSAPNLVFLVELTRKP